jgi:hypothetical protein
MHTRLAISALGPAKAISGTSPAVVKIATATIILSILSTSAAL